MTTKADYITNLKNDIGDGILVSVDADTSEGELTEYNGSRKYQHYLANCKTVGTDENGNEISEGWTHHFCVFDEGEAGEDAIPIRDKWSNPAQRDPSGSNLQNINDIYYNERLRDKTSGAMIKAAHDVLNEAESVAHHDDRLAFAGSVMLDVTTYLGLFMFYVANNATVQTNGPGSTTDNDIQYIVNSSWNSACEATGNWTAS